MSSAVPMPMQRGFALLISIALALAALLPFAVPRMMQAASPDIVISQVYGGGGNSGATLTHDFIELYNRGAAAVDVSGWSVQYASSAGTSWQRTNLTGFIEAGGHYLVQEAQGMGGTTSLPTPDATGAIPMSGTSGKVALVTNQTTLSGCGTAAAPCLSNPAIRDFVGYGTGASEFEGSGSTLSTSNTTAALRKGDGATDTDDNQADFTIGTPNPRNSGNVEPESVEIWEIQGAGHLSEYDGHAVSEVEGVVTAISNSGFWMEDPTPDEDDATSNGIFVFRGRNVAIGDLVTVNGTVDEFRPGGSGGSENLTTTELTNATVTVVSSGNELPTTVIGVDRLPPTEIIDDDSTDSVEASNAVYDPESDGIDFWESLEGMRLEVANAVAVGPTNGFGEIAVISQAQEDAGVRTVRGGIIVRNLTGTGDYQPGDFNPERVILDDVITATPRLNTGDEFATDPVGVLDYGFGNFKLLITEDPGRVDNGLAREVTADQGAQDLAVATFNVENLSAVDCLSDPDKVATLASQVVNNLQAPDLVAIEEMQDNSGDVDDEPDGDDGTVGSDQSWECLIDAIVAAGGPVYDYRQIDPEDGEDGGVPGGNIRVGFLFNSDRGLEFVDRPGGDATTDTDVVAAPSGKGAQLTVSPGRVLDSPDGMESAFDDTRKPLAGEFRWRGETIFVVANHFSSKGDDRPLFGHFQPPYRLTEFESGNPEDGWRHAQAQTINDFVDEILAVDPNANVIVLGDINDFDFSETVEILTGERVALDPGPFMPDENGSGQTAESGEGPVMHTLFETLPSNERYSYVFDGNSQVLDQILVSNSLWNLGTTYDVVHVNAEFFDQASDHDPSVMRVAFQPRSSMEAAKRDR